MRIIFLFLLVNLFCTAATFADTSQSTGPKYRSYLNNISCGQIVDGLDNEASRKAYVLMIGSFVSGSNYAKNRDSQSELKGMLMLTEQFCRQNPELPVMAALIYLDKKIDQRIAATKE